MERCSLEERRALSIGVGRRVSSCGNGMRVMAVVTRHGYGWGNSSKGGSVAGSDQAEAWKATCRKKCRARKAKRGEPYDR